MQINVKMIKQTKNKPKKSIDFYMGRLPWIIQLAQSNHMTPSKVEHLS
jgi:hypothetical protein